MKYRFDGYNWIVRIERGEKLTKKLTELIESENIPTCWISGLGACQNAELGFYDIDKKEYKWKKFGDMEILSLQGNVSWLDGEVSLHIHGSFSDDKMNSIGGHVKELTANGTIEIFLHRWYGDNVTRSKDNSTGLNLLDL